MDQMAALAGRGQRLGGVSKLFGPWRARFHELASVLLAASPGFLNQRRCFRRHLRRTWAAAVREE